VEAVAVAVQRTIAPVFQAAKALDLLARVAVAEVQITPAVARACTAQVRAVTNLWVSRLWLIRQAVAVAGAVTRLIALGEMVVQVFALLSIGHRRYTWHTLQK
jgi:hypothetical protein